MIAQRLSFLCAGALACLSASAQSVGRIPVTDAGLVPAPAFNPMAQVRREAASAPAAAPQQPAAFPDFGAGSTWQLARSLIPPGPASQLMSQYVVREGEMPEFRLRDLYTKAGLGDLALREHPGLRFGNVLNSNAEQAHAMIQEEERLKDIQDFQDTARAIDMGGDSKGAHGILEATHDAFARNEHDPSPANDMLAAPPPRTGTILTNLEQMRLTWLEDRF